MARLIFGPLIVITTLILIALVLMMVFTQEVICAIRGFASYAKKTFSKKTDGSR